MKTDTPDVSALSLKAQVDISCVQFLNDNSRSAILTNVVLSILMSVVIWLEVGTTSVAYWLAANVILSGLRLMITRRFPENSNNPQEYLKWASLYTIGAAAGGLTWGSAAFIYADPTLPMLDVFMVLCVLGISTGATISLYAFYRAYVAFTMPIMLLLVAALAMRADIINTTLAAMGLLFLIMLLITARKSNQMLRTSLEERFRNEALAHDLGHARDEAEKANLAKSEFLAAMSHELRTPLTSSLGSLRLLSSLEADNLSEQAQELIEISLRNNDKLLILVNELLDYEKVLSGTLVMDTDIHNICSLSSRIVNDHQGYAQAKSIRFVFKEPPAPLYAEVQEHRFEQILNNLLSNAAKFSDPGSEVEITVHKADGQVVVSVKDHGTGIPEYFREQIYDQFTQVDASSTRKYGGTGLGLAISKGLAEGMGGTIDFETEMGVGTTFYVKLSEVKSP